MFAQSVSPALSAPDFVEYELSLSLASWMKTLASLESVVADAAVTAFFCSEAAGIAAELSDSVALSTAVSAPFAALAVAP